MPKETSGQELIVSRQILSIPQHFSTGPVLGRFLRELRDNKRIMANKCPKCGRHQLPPREVCALCHVEATEWDELPPVGTVRDFDVIYYASPDPLSGETRQVPYVLCWVDLDGTQGDAPFWHLLDVDDLAKVKRGVRVRMVFAEDRHGTTEDIKYFEIIEPEAGRQPPVASASPAATTGNSVIEGKMALPYQYYAGATGSTFLVALRDERKILGVRCDACNKTFVPPRQTCERCFAPLTEKWVTLEPAGTVTGFTVVRYAEPYQPKEPPYVLALIQLDGADTPIPHLLECGGVQNAKVGMRVHAVFAEERRDSILAISHFEELV